MESVFQLVAGALHGGDSPSDRAARRSTRARREQLYAEAVAVIESRHADPLDVDDVARAVFASRRQLQRVFAEIGGTTVREAIARTRLERAAQLLRDSGTPVKDVGAAVGLPEAAQFAKAFRRRYGVSPTEYRRRGDRSR